MKNQGEIRILFKTPDAAYDALVRTIRELHSYELPAIHAFRIDRIFAPYAEWVVKNSSGESRR